MNRLLLTVVALLLAVALPAAAAKRPFPQHVSYTAGVIKPTNVSQQTMDSLVARYYARWKITYLRNAGGDDWVKYDATNSTVSEAHGYGMVLAAYMADRPLFDSLRRYYKKHPSSIGPHLMAWKQTLRNGAMVNVEGSDSATDGDLDIAYALLLADAQWGSTAAVDYRADALAALHDILAFDVNAATVTLKPGDWAEGFDANHTRPSDFMTDHLLAFARADTANAARWQAIHGRIAAIVNHQFATGSAATGLMPDFMVKSGADFVPVSGAYLESVHDGDFSYNACRTPWRLAMSYIVQGRTGMLPALRRQSAWIAAATLGDPGRIRAGYYVRNGTNGKAFVNYGDLAFTAPFAVNAMVGGSARQAWLNALWTSITGGDFGPVEDYYGDTIRLQVMLTVSGNWWVP